MRKYFFILIFLLLSQQLWAQENPAALVCDVKGKAQHRAQSSGSWSNLAIFDQLGEKAVIQLPKGSSVDLSFVEGGTQATLQGPCRVELQGQEVRLLAGAAKNLKMKRPTQQKGRLAPVGLNIDRMGGLVRPKAAEEPRWITDAVVMAGTVKVEWDAPAEYKKFKVEVTDEDGEPFFSKETTVNQIMVDSIAPDTLYLIRFCAWKSSSEEPDFEWNGALESLNQELTSSLRAHPSNSTAEKSVLLSHYYTNELYGPALELCVALLELRPGDTNLQTMKEYLETIREGRGL